MSKAMQLVGIILLGIFTLVIIYLMNDVRSTNELDYYLLQEVTEASMYDSVDYSYYRETGLLKVDRDMFLENFSRRFAESVSNDRDYTIKIIDFNETPPKVSVEVSAPSVASVKGETALIINRVSGIIETVYDDYVYSRGEYGNVDIDEEPPKIIIKNPTDGSNVFDITITDNYVLQKYAIVDSSGGAITTDIYNSIKDWIMIDGYVDKYHTTYTMPAGKTGVWVVAVDRNGLWSYKSISDVTPWITGSMNVNQDLTARELKLTFRDDIGLSSYTITPVLCRGVIGGTGYVDKTCSSGWTSSGVPITETIKDVTSTTENGMTIVKKDVYLSRDIGYYSITVTDNTGHVSRPYVVLFPEKHKISISYVDNKSDFNKIDVSITDTWGDLTAYQIINSAKPDDTKWISISGGSKTLTSDTLDRRNYDYYVYVRDSTGLTYHVQVPVKKPQLQLPGSTYSIKHGCSGVWREGNSEGCFGDRDGQSWNHNDNILKDFEVNTNDYSRAVINVSGLKFDNMSKLSSAPNCSIAGRCSYRLVAVINGKDTVIRSWGVDHQKKVWPSEYNDNAIVIDFNSLGVKNTGVQTLQLKIETGGVNGLYYFEGNINNITLE